MNPALELTIRVTRPVRLRGRDVPTGVYPASRTHGGWCIAHPAGIEGAFAFVPRRNAEEVTA